MTTPHSMIPNQMLPRKWEIVRTNRAMVFRLARTLGVPPIVVQILIARGIDSPEGAKRFLNPAVEHIGDPYLLTDMEPAVERIKQAVRNGERILVYGDYDVDGVAGTALLYRALCRMGARGCAYDVPHRLTEGFGLSSSRVRQAYEEGFSLIITVDNGTSAHEAAATAKGLGIDLIVTDHHQADAELPCAKAIINGAREKEGHISAHACGVALAYKLAWALTNERHDLDLVALGTVADVVPLIGENRDFVYTGLESIARQPRPGIEALARKTGLNFQKLKTEDVAFYLAPRLNAAGRLASARTSLELLLTESKEEAFRLADVLEEVNQERKRLEQETLEEAIKILEEQRGYEKTSIVLGSHQWHPGIVGIVAARLQAKFGVPVILVVFDKDGLGRGSARSVDGINVSEALSACQEYLVDYGGHKAAAGVTLREEALDKFREKFDEIVSQKMPREPRLPDLSVDAVVSLTEIDGRLMKALEQLAPFGHGNPPPCFLSQQVRVLPNSVRDLKGDHLKFAVQEGPRVLPAIAFRMSHRREELVRSSVVDIVYSPQQEYWQGEPTIQLRVKDFKSIS